ncbi:MAG: TetR family transcriptional regulator C-terminal domain-containing protein [Lachnospiraceae bacterium]|nr:TetR family transcriptional regulator C-terminal domain-containing protein [Lachnospiraceae bacterium]
MMIKKVFLKLLKEKPLEKITVKEICEFAEINRATFYKYYDNPFDLMTKLEEELLVNLQNKIDAIGTSRFDQIFKVILEDVKENEQFYRMTFDEASDTRFRKRLFELCYGDNMQTIKELFVNLDDKGREWLYYFVAEGSNGILKRWLDGGMTESVDEIANFAESLIKGINERLPAVLTNRDKANR